MATQKVGISPGTLSFFLVFIFPNLFLLLNLRKMSSDCFFEADSLEHVQQKLNVMEELLGLLSLFLGFLVCFGWVVFFSFNSWPYCLLRDFRTRVRFGTKQNLYLFGSLELGRGWAERPGGGGVKRLLFGMTVGLRALRFVFNFSFAHSESNQPHLRKNPMFWVFRAA